MALPARRILILSYVLMGAGMASAAPRRPLDRVRIHALYHDGEFERILRELAPYGKGECACGKDDSAFAEKHLAVVLAAAPATRELGRYHMFRLLDLSPRADLLDMYVGEEVDAVFEKVRKEHDLRASALSAKPPAPSPAAIAAPASISSGPAFSEAWAKAAEAGSRAPVRSRPTAAMHPRTAAAKTYTPWDASPAIRTPFGTVWTPPGTAEAASAAALPGSLSAPPPVAAASARPGSEADSSRPAWKQPGIWIGGGAAIAAIAFTLWHSGSEGGSPGKTYAVPASLSK